MNDLILPKKGKSAASLLQELNADHAPRPADEIERTNDSSNEETNERYNVTTNERTIKPANTLSGPSTVTPVKIDIGVDSPVPISEERTERFSRALLHAATDEISVVTVRAPTRLNEYMDRYVERVNRQNPKRRYRKQDAIAEAFAAFFADHPMPPVPSEEDI